MSSFFAFGSPWAAALLPLPWLWWLLGRRLVSRQRGALSRLVALLQSSPPKVSDGQRLLHPHLGYLTAAYQGRPWPGAGRARLHWSLLALLWAALVLAFMRPQWLEPQTEITTPGYDLMLAVDASHSMDALDFSVEGEQVSRMAVVKGVMSRFVEERSGDRVGLIVFGSSAYQLSPLTTDRTAVRQLLESLVPGIAGASTALGDALALGTKKLRDRPAGSRVMILIADGDNTEGDFQPLESAALARDSGVRIYVIGVGSQDERIPILHQGRVEYWDDLTMDETTLRAIARTTGGSYFRATDADALNAISQRISELEPSDSETRTAWLPKPLYRWPLLIAAAALVGLGFLRALPPPAILEPADRLRRQGGLGRELGAR